MFFDEDECISAIECVHTKYTLKCIEELFKENKLQNEKFLFIVKPAENIEIEMTKFILPRTLYEQVGHLLIPNCNDYNEHYVLLETNNSLDIWLLFKLYHKEASYYIAKYMKSFFESNIYPSNFLFKRGD